MSKYDSPATGDAVAAEAAASQRKRTEEVGGGRWQNTRRQKGPCNTVASGFEIMLLLKSGVR